MFPAISILPHLVSALSRTATLKILPAIVDLVLSDSMSFLAFALPYALLGRPVI
jgi:hypothetical protein